MQFTLGFAVLAATLAAVRGASIAAPVLEASVAFGIFILHELTFSCTQRAEDLEARAAQVDGHIYICTDDNFSGSCTNYGFTANQCSNFPSGFQDNISSVGPDKGWVCTLFMYALLLLALARDSKLTHNLATTTATVTKALTMCRTRASPISTTATTSSAHSVASASTKRYALVTRQEWRWGPTPGSLG